MAGLSRDCNHEEVGSSQRCQTCWSCRRSRGGKDSVWDCLKNENVFYILSWDCFWYCFLKNENVSRRTTCIWCLSFWRGERFLKFQQRSHLQRRRHGELSASSLSSSSSSSSSLSSSSTLWKGRLVIPFNLPSILLCPCLKYFGPERQMFHISAVYKQMQTCESSDCEGEERFHAEAITIYLALLLLLLLLIIFFQTIAENPKEIQNPHCLHWKLLPWPPSRSLWPSSWPSWSSSWPHSWSLSPL